MLVDRFPNTGFLGAKSSGCLVVLRWAASVGWSVNSAGAGVFGPLVGAGSCGPAAAPDLPRGAHGRGMVDAATAIHVATRDTSDTRRLLIHSIPRK